MSIQTEIERLRAAKADIIAKIEEKGVEVPDAIYMDQLASYISEISTDAVSEGADASKPVKFYDYDGALLYSYTLPELQALTNLPPLPSHDGLTCQGWNWTLAELKELGRAMNVGAMYVTDNGATRLHITISDLSRNEIPLYFYQTVDGGVTIDWGDGSAAQTVSGTGYVSTSHVYTAVRDYTISLLPTSNCTLRLGHNNSGYCVLGPVNESTRPITNVLRKVHLGLKITAVLSYSFQYCRGLTAVSIPSAVTSMGNYSFNFCNSLSAVVVPTRVTSIPTYTFGSCFGLRVVCLDPNVTTIGASAFRYCHSLSGITIPPKITTLNGYCFSECYSIQYASIPDTVTTMGNFVFYKCYALSQVTLPSNLTSIGTNVFYQNYSLSAIDIPDTVTSIGAYAFYDCHALQSLDIPAGVTAINTTSFANCYGMKKYIFHTSTPPTLATTAFTGIPDDCIIYIPDGSAEAYLADSNWALFVSYIQEY